MKIKYFGLGVISGLVLLAAGIGIWLNLGGMPMGTANPPLPLEKQLAHYVLSVSMRGQTGLASPVAYNESAMLKGARVYQVSCAVCHGLPHQAQSAIAQGMFPPVPKLMPPNKGVTDDEVGETYWKVKNGIRLSGMPGFQKTLTDTEMWQVSLLVLHADQLSEAVKTELPSK